MILSARPVFCGRIIFTGGARDLFFLNEPEIYVLDPFSLKTAGMPAVFGFGEVHAYYKKAIHSASKSLPLILLSSQKLGYFFFWLLTLVYHCIMLIIHVDSMNLGESL